jgi:hypothetical protein
MHRSDAIWGLDGMQSAGAFVLDDEASFGLAHAGRGRRAPLPARAVLTRL